jgi:phospholipid N-methyltransferase
MNEHVTERSPLPQIAPGNDADYADSSWQRFGLFATHFFREPCAVGTIFPSSRALVRRTLAAVPWNQCRVCVEYGPGTGVFTRAILQHLRPDAMLVCLDVSDRFVQFLRDNVRDRRLHVIHDSAANIRDVLCRLGASQADVAISGIPFRPMPSQLARHIVTETSLALAPEGSLHVYQVSSAVHPHLRAVFPIVKREFEPFNLLPTLLYRCFKQAS